MLSGISAVSKILDLSIFWSKSLSITIAYMLDTPVSTELCDTCEGTAAKCLVQLHESTDKPLLDLECN